MPESMMTDNPIAKVRGSQGIPEGYRTLAAFLAVLCLAAYAMGANPFRGQTVAPFDLLLALPGWSADRINGSALNSQPSDILDGVLPVWVTLKRQIREGKGALWYPDGGGGEPISLEIGNPAFLLFLLIKDNALALYLVGLAKLVVAGFGAFLLARVFLRRLAALWAGLAYMLCGFNAAWFFWDQVTTSVWIPWLLWATVRYLLAGDRRWLPAIALFSLLMILGGFPAVAAFGFYSFAIIIVLWLSPSLVRRLRTSRTGLEGTGQEIFPRLLLPFLAVALAFLMAAFALIPFADNMSAFNLGYRTEGGTSFNGLRDLSLFFHWEEPLAVERTAYIGGLAAALALLGSLIVPWEADRRRRKFLAITAFLTLLSLAIAYGLLPDALIRSLPVFHTNRWSRLIVIPLLGISLLSAAGLERVMAGITGLRIRGLTGPVRGAAWAAVLVAVLCLAFQFSAQKRFFDRYNAVVPSSWFYPKTPSIAYVQERLQPLQSVIADNSFLTAGTLGAYGIPEWYAHTFRTDREKEVLAELVRDPFASPTSSYIYGKAIDFDSPLMDALAIRFVLVNRSFFASRWVLAPPDGRSVLAPSLLRNSWLQHFILPRDAVIGVFGFLFRTENGRPAPAGVRLSLYDGQGRKYSVQPELASRAISPDGWTYFRFPGGVSLRKGRYTVELSPEGDGRTGALSALAGAADPSRGNYLELNGARSGLCLSMAVGTYDPIDLRGMDKRWEVRSLEPEILVFENKDVTGSGYFLPSLDGSAAPDFAPVAVKQPAADRLLIDYQGDRSGWVVLPMHLHPGWKASRGGQPVAYDSYLGMLPAIPVSGPSRTLFRYEPPSFRAGAALSAAGAALFVLFSWWCLRRKRGRGAPQSVGKGGMT